MTCKAVTNIVRALATDHILMQLQVFSKRKLGVAIKFDHLLVCENNL